MIYDFRIMNYDLQSTSCHPEPQVKDPLNNV